MLIRILRCQYGQFLYLVWLIDEFLCDGASTETLMGNFLGVILDFWGVIVLSMIGYHAFATICNDPRSFQNKAGGLEGGLRWGPGGKDP